MTGTLWQELKGQKLSCMRRVIGRNLWPIVQVASRGQSRCFGLSLENSPAHHFVIKIPQTWRVRLFKYHLNNQTRRHQMADFLWKTHFLPVLLWRDEPRVWAPVSATCNVIFTQMTITNDCHNLRAASQVINNQQPARISADEKIIIAGPWKLEQLARCVSWNRGEKGKSWVNILLMNNPHEVCLMWNKSTIFLSSVLCFCPAAS